MQSDPADAQTTAIGGAVTASKNCSNKAYGYIREHYQRLRTNVRTGFHVRT